MSSASSRQPARTIKVKPRKIQLRPEQVSYELGLDIVKEELSISSSIVIKQGADKILSTSIKKGLVTQGQDQRS